MKFVPADNYKDLKVQASAFEMPIEWSRGKVEIFVEEDCRVQSCYNMRLPWFLKEQAS